jgi:glutathione S-transferase
MYQLYIGNKVYSSWSLRPWVLLRSLDIGFTEQLVPFGDPAAWTAYRRISPSGKVPALVDAGVWIWDSLAITEYLAERHPGVWPSDAMARAWARSAAAEMHSSFSELRHRCSMCCGVRIRLFEQPAPLEHDVARIARLWTEGLGRYGGPFLAGRVFTAVDAFFAPVVFRAQTYGLSLDAKSQGYLQHMLAQPAVKQWYDEAVQERFRDAEHEEHVARMGTLLEDYRAH